MLTIHKKCFAAQISYVTTPTSTLVHSTLKFQSQKFESSSISNFKIVNSNVIYRCNHNFCLSNGDTRLLVLIE